MASAHLLRLQIEASLADRIPSALTPAPRVIRPTAPTGIPVLDEALGGGLPVGAITEFAGPECSGRTSLALSFVASLTSTGHVCAWVDVSDTLHPESAAAIGVDLARLLWIRCSPAAQQLTLPGFAPGQKSPINSLKKKNVSAAVTFSPAVRKPTPQDHDPTLNYVPRCAERLPKARRQSREAMQVNLSSRSGKSSAPPNSKLQTLNSNPLQPVTCNLSPAPFVTKRREYSRLDQALRATDLLLQAGGFSAIVLDMGSVAPEFALRVPLATWFRYRAAAERTHASVLLLTQHTCTKSSAGLVLHCQPSQASSENTTVLTGAEHRVEIARERFAKVADFARKPPQSDHSILWKSRTPWASAQTFRPEKTGRK
jgi:hypothetical protein